MIMSWCIWDYYLVILNYFLVYIWQILNPETYTELEQNHKWRNYLNNTYKNQQDFMFFSLSSVFILEHSFFAKVLENN